MSRSARTTCSLVVASVLLGGCTAGGDDPEDVGNAGTSDAPGASAGAAPVGSEEPDALTSEEISAQVLDQGEAFGDREPLATVQAEVPLSPADAVLTLDIVEVVASSTGTVLTMRVSAPQPVTAVRETFSAQRFVNPEYIDDIDLVDAGAQETLRPIAAAEGGRWCQCSVIPSSISSVPTPLSATFPALDEATSTVDVRFGSFPVVEDVPVTR